MNVRVAHALACLDAWAQDQSSTTQKALSVAQAIPGAELHIFDQCAHWVMWDREGGGDSLAPRVPLGVALLFAAPSRARGAQL